MDEKRRCAEQFLLSYYPSALEDLTFSKSKQLSRVDRFYFEQIVMDLPLEHAGCFIDVDALGNIVGFR
ncbi:YcdB/YcdC domain-containing protein [Lysinibacillus sp. NPDC058147]|uniref:YcdB/YcdC domain-containing protein n=1 Tax=unclassified Lysinibacillus TaxID=2636778 RepID=UPI0036DF6F78